MHDNTDNFISFPQEMYVQVLSTLLSLQSVLHVDVRQRQLDCVSNVSTRFSSVPVIPCFRSRFSIPVGKVSVPVGT